MAGLQMKITTLGRAALVNAENTGTLPVLVSEVGVTATAFVPGAGTIAIPAEIKRLTTFAGAAVADDTIHVTISDDSTDVYSLRGFGLYLADGTLFAVYGQAGVILEKSAQATLLLSADVIFADIAATSLSFGDANFLNPQATTETVGVVELATSVEAITGADLQRAMTPFTDKAAMDSRLGAGAPTTFAKSLLSIATAGLLRAALELTSVATKAEGHGNGIDADTLDGQHGTYYLAWANFSGKPGSFPPSEHNQDASTINSGTLDVARIPALTISKTTGLQSALDSKATTGASVIFSQTGNINAGTPTAGYTTYGNTGSRYFGWDGSSYVVGDVAGVPVVAWTGLNFNPAAKANVGSGNVFSADQDILGTANASWLAHTVTGGQYAAFGTAVSVGGAYAGSFSNHPFGFFTNGQRRGEITAAGALVWIGGIQAGQIFTTGAASVILAPGAAGTVNLRPNGPGSATGAAVLNAAGELSAVSFNSTSSRLVKDLEPGPAPYGLKEVLQIETAAGKYKNDYIPNDRRRLFLVAENLREIMPEVVFENGVNVTIDGEEMSVPTVEMTQTIPVLVNAIQELSAMISEERARREAIERRLIALGP